MQSERASLGELTRTPFIGVVTYPKMALRQAKARIRQLEQLGVEELIFEGRTKIGRLGILGLGTVGVVVAAKTAQGTRAVKIRRLDANRPDMHHESSMAAKANAVGVGPRVYGHTKDVILMELLRSVEIDVWLKGLQGPGTRGAARAVVHSLLNQCRKLDIMGIDHGQLSNLRKHAVVVDGAPRIIDFESASVARKPRNVTAAAQYLFIGGSISPRLRRTMGIRDVKPLLALLSRYKSEGTDYAYSKILDQLRLGPRPRRA